MSFVDKSWPSGSVLLGAGQLPGLKRAELQTVSNRAAEAQRHSQRITLGKSVVVRRCSRCLGKRSWSGATHSRGRSAAPVTDNGGLAFPQGLIRTGATPRGDGACENRTRPMPAPGPQRGGALPSTSGTPGPARQVRRTGWNRKVASNIGRRRRAPEKAFGVHTHPIVVVRVPIGHATSRSTFKIYVRQPCSTKKWKNPR